MKDDGKNSTLFSTPLTISRRQYFIILPSGTDSDILIYRAAEIAASDAL